MSDLMRRLAALEHDDEHTEAVKLIQRRERIADEPSPMDYGFQLWMESIREDIGK